MVLSLYSIHTLLFFLTIPTISHSHRVVSFHSFTIDFPEAPGDHGSILITM